MHTIPLYPYTQSLYVRAIPTFTQFTTLHLQSTYPYPTSPVYPQTCSLQPSAPGYPPHIFTPLQLVTAILPPHIKFGSDTLNTAYPDPLHSTHTGLLSGQANLIAVTHLSPSPKMRNLFWSTQSLITFLGGRIQVLYLAWVDVFRSCIQLWVSVFTKCIWHWQG